jgi:cellulose synthase/poly-beta-1,6-N-acetylglucosamine synthase-like glycosyltransferase
MKNILDVAVVICTYSEKRWDFLETTVKSLLAQDSPASEVIVVVDHNPTLRARVTAAFPEVKVVENTQPQGLSGARNSGIAASTASIIAFVDDDVIAPPDLLERLYAPYTDPNVVGVGGKAEPLWIGGKPKWFPAEFNWVVGCTYQGMPTVSQPVRNLIGCNMSMRREVFQGVGDFHSALGKVGDSIDICCEETELCIRATRKWPGKIFLYEPRAVVQHMATANRCTFAYFRHRSFQEGLAKSLVSRFVGSVAGLANERSYTLKVLPKGVLKGVADTLRGDASGLLRSGAIIAGLTFTITGYVVGTLRGALASQDAAQKAVTPVVEKQ